MGDYTGFLIALGIGILFSIFSCIVIFIPEKPKPYLEFMVKRLPRRVRSEDTRQKNRR